MARRSVDWELGLAEDLRDLDFAHEFIKTGLSEGMSIQEVLGMVVRAFGVTEFAAKAKIPGPNLLRALNPKHNPTMATINKILRPFGLELSVAPSARRRVA